jgi:RNA polymerase sigma-70 factor (ECF subfamily)
MQETFINAYLHLSQFEFRSSLKTWMIKIMLHQCQRKEKKFSHTHEMAMAIDDQSVPFYSNPHQHDTGKEILNRELNHVIEQAILKVPQDYRTVFSLREINGLSVTETAEVMQISEANVKVRLNRAKIMLRKEMEQTYTAEEIFDFNLVYCDAMVQRVMLELEKLNPFGVD